VDVIYLDFAKAFDKVPHKRLCLKVKNHGIDGDVLRWIELWLSDRMQQVVINGAASGWTNSVISGVPQGSVLGPTLFLIYINDIDEAVTSLITKFADDTKLYKMIKTVEDAISLQEDLHRVLQWSKDWMMLFNIEKCKVIHLGYNNTIFNYEMEGNSLIEDDEERDLGVLVHQTLKPSAHCVQAAKKGHIILAMIYRSFECKTKDIVLRLYKQYKFGIPI